eukprot:scaffold327216_cov81-Tisochrysis_lutea.AAC.1
MHVVSIFVFKGILAGGKFIVPGMGDICEDRGGEREDSNGRGVRSVTSGRSMSSGLLEFEQPGRTSDPWYWTAWVKLERNLKRLCATPHSPSDIGPDIRYTTMW